MVGYHSKGMATLVKGYKHNQDISLMQREIYVAYGLKDKHASIFTHIIQLFFYINVHGVFLLFR